MPAFKRVFRSFPGFDELLDIESVNIIEITPPGDVAGSGTGTVLLVAEFENGAVNTPFEVFGATDLVTKSGSLGHPVADNQHANPVAVKSGGDELWNGSGFVWLRNKKFSGLILCRVDNSAGQVQFSRLACLSGGAGPFVAANAGTTELTKDGTTTVIATWTGSKATLAGASGSFPTGFVGGETVELKVDDDSSRVVLMTAAEQTAINVRDRINAVLALDVAVENGGEVDFQSVKAGGAARIEIVGGTAIATIGHPTAVVAHLDTLTINANTGGGNFTLRAQVNVDGVLTDFDGTFPAGGGDSVTVVRDGLLAAMQLLAVPGVTYSSDGAADIKTTGGANILFTSSVIDEPAGGDMTIALTTPGVVLVAFGLGNVPDLGRIEANDAVIVYDALTGISSDVSDGLLRVCNTGTPGTGTLQVTGGTEVTSFGFDLVSISDAADGEDVTIRAGTRVADSSATGTVWITLEDIDTGTGGGAFNALVRPASDDDTALASTASNVTLILDDLPDGFSVTNASSITRLSSSLLDARYTTAIDATLAGDVAAKANMIAAARSSESIMRKLKLNAIDATAAGLAARKTIIRPLIATTRVVATGATGQGVAATGIARDERVFYLFPGAVTVIPEIQSVGARGGVGFTDDGSVETGADSFYASTRSILPPEENVGQNLSDTNVVGLNILSLEDAFEPSEGGVGLVIEDYKAFLAAGIIALKNYRTSGFVFQSDVTSVDPEVDPAKKDANRRFFTDFIIDTLGTIGERYAKKLNTRKRRNALILEARGFLLDLQAPNQPDFSRLDSFSVVDTATDEQTASGIVLLSVTVKMHSVMLSITFTVEVGTNVVITEAAA